MKTARNTRSKLLSATVALTLACGLLLGLAACGNDASPPQIASETTPTPADTPSPTPTPEPTPTPTPEPTPTPAPTPTPEPTPEPGAELEGLWTSESYDEPKIGAANLENDLATYFAAGFALTDWADEMLFTYAPGWYDDVYYDGGLAVWTDVDEDVVLETFWYVDDDGSLDVSFDFRHIQTHSFTYSIDGDTLTLTPHNSNSSRAYTRTS